MNQLKDAKKTYDDIQIPEELAKRVDAAVARSRKKQGFEAETTSRRKIVPIIKYRRIIKTSAAAAAVVLLFSVLLNTNTAFAETMSSLPVIGPIARVLTFRSYTKEEEGVKLDVVIPSVEMIAKDRSGLAASVNKTIYSLCEAYAQESKKRAEEYHQAFIDTGGTEEDWENHKIEIKVWYEIMLQSDKYLSLAVMGSESWNSAGSEAQYYNLDLASGKVITLKDLLGEDYLHIADESIREQMEQKAAETGVAFWTAEEGGFTGITDSTRFYINDAGNPVIVFEKYEIAPGTAGRPEFEIVR